MKFEIVPSIREHILPIADDMRICDVKEIFATALATPKEALEYGFEKGKQTYTALVDDRPAIMFGVVSGGLLSNKGIPWLLATNDVKKVKKKFVQNSLPYVEQFLSQYKCLENYVHEENEDSIRWLEWCGFELVERVKYGMMQEWFWRFRKENEVCAIQ